MALIIKLISLLSWIIKFVRNCLNGTKKNFGKDYLPATSIPGPTSFPFIGAQWQYWKYFGRYDLAKYHESNDDKFEKYGPIVRENVLWQFPIYHLFAKKDIENVLRLPSKFPIRPPNEADMLVRMERPDIYNNIGLPNANMEQWHHLRHKLTPPLRKASTTTSLTPKVDSIASDLVQLMSFKMGSGSDGRGSLSNFKELIYRTCLESVIAISLEKRMGFLDLNDNHGGGGAEKNAANGRSISDPSHLNSIMEAVCDFQKASSESLYGFALWKYDWVRKSSNWLLSKFCKSFHTLMRVKMYLFHSFGKIVDELIEEEMENLSTASVEEDGRSMLSSLLTMIQDKQDNHGLDLKDIKACVVDYITAGMDTVGNSLIFLVWLLAKNPEAQKKLAEELDSAFPNRAEITHEGLGETPYLHACVMESFRMLPTASQIARVLDTDVACSGYILPAGSVVLLHTRIASLQNENFFSANRFLPERWIDSKKDDGALAHSPDLVRPFGAGKRICPGKKLAEQEIYVFVAKIIQSFEVEFSEDLELEFQYLLTPSGDIPLKLKQRK